MQAHITYICSINTLYIKYENITTANFIANRMLHTCISNTHVHITSTPLLSQHKNRWDKCPPAYRFSFFCFDATLNAIATACFLGLPSTIRSRISLATVHCIVIIRVTISYIVDVCICSVCFHGRCSRISCRSTYIKLAFMVEEANCHCTHCNCEAYQ